MCPLHFLQLIYIFHWVYYEFPFNLLHFDDLFSLNSFLIRTGLFTNKSASFEYFSNVGSIRFIASLRRLDFLLWSEKLKKIHYHFLQTRHNLIERTIKLHLRGDVVAKSLFQHVWVDKNFGFLLPPAPSLGRNYVRFRKLTISIQAGNITLKDQIWKNKRNVRKIYGECFFHIKATPFYEHRNCQ